MKGTESLDCIGQDAGIHMSSLNHTSPKKRTKHVTKVAPAESGFEKTYKAAGDIVKSYGISVEDVANLGDRFWQYYLDGLCLVDPAATVIVSIHWNLCMGTISRYMDEQPHLHILLEELAAFRLCGEFMLTEVGHGLDARNIETTATLSSDGLSFDLHSPCNEAAKSMPPTTPLGGVPKIAVVFAQLVIDGKERGVRAFVVHLTNGSRMCEGISTSLLPQRPGSRPIDHALTMFTHVKIHRDCLLGSIEGSTNERQSFFDQIHRVSVGGLALSLCNVPAMKACAYLTAKFSQQRMVINPATRSPVPIISFPTQYGPIITAMAQGAIMEANGRFSIGAFLLRGLPEPLKHALVCIFKAIVTQATQRCLSELTDRCGWRGLFAFNKISEIQLALKGNSIAEGDVLVLCIRLASELLQDKYQLPPSENPDSLLARHEHGLFKELKQFVTRDEEGNTNHRSDYFAQNVTPRARDLVHAIGHRFAYDNALSSGLVRKELMDVWEADCILQNAAWYVEHAGMKSREIHQRYTTAIESVRPLIGEIMVEFDMEKHFGETPLVSKEHWDEFMDGLPRFGDGSSADEA